MRIIILGAGQLVPRLINTRSYHVVPAKAGIHAQHDHNSTSGMDPHRRGDDNKVPTLQDEPLGATLARNLAYWR